MIQPVDTERNQKDLLFSKSVSNRFLSEEPRVLRGGSTDELGQEDLSPDSVWAIHQDPLLRKQKYKTIRTGVDAGVGPGLD